jgi:hypothetical protein
MLLILGFLDSRFRGKDRLGPGYYLQLWTVTEGSARRWPHLFYWAPMGILTSIGEQRPRSNLDGTACLLRNTLQVGGRLPRCAFNDKARVDKARVDEPRDD